LGGKTQAVKRTANEEKLRLKNEYVQREQKLQADASRDLQKKCLELEAKNEQTEFRHNEEMARLLEENDDLK